jgi:hypothetical protein
MFEPPRNILLLCKKTGKVSVLPNDDIYMRWFVQFPLRALNTNKKRQMSPSLKWNEDDHVDAMADRISTMHEHWVAKHLTTSTLQLKPSFRIWRVMKASHESDIMYVEFR